MSKIENCENCGGTHYGSVDCPYLEKNMGEPCVVCAERTSYCCSDCGIDGAGKVYICIADACRTEHEKKHKPAARVVTHEMVLKAEAAWLDRDEWLRTKAHEDNRAWYRANIRAALEAVISTLN